MLLFVSSYFVVHSFFTSFTHSLTHSLTQFTHFLFPFLQTLLALLIRCFLAWICWKESSHWSACFYFFSLDLFKLVIHPSIHPWLLSFKMKQNNAWWSFLFIFFIYIKMCVCAHVRPGRSPDSDTARSSCCCDTFVISIDPTCYYYCCCCCCCYNSLLTL